MPTLFATATAVEDNVLDTMKMAEDAVIHTAHTFAEAFEPVFEPVIKRLSGFPFMGSMPAPAEVVDHTFGFVDKLEANLRDFADRFVEVLSVKVDVGPPTAVKATPGAKAA